MTGLWVVPVGITMGWLMAELWLEDRSSIPIGTATALGLPMALGSWLTWGLSWLL